MDVRGVQSPSISNTQRRVCFSETTGIDNPSPVSILFDRSMSASRLEKQTERVGIRLIRTAVNDTYIWMITIERKNIVYIERVEMGQRCPVQGPRRDPIETRSSLRSVHCIHILHWSMMGKRKQSRQRTHADPHYVSIKDCPGSSTVQGRLWMMTRGQSCKSIMSRGEHLLKYGLHSRCHK